MTNICNPLEWMNPPLSETLVGWLRRRGPCMMWWMVLQMPTMLLLLVKVVSSTGMNLVTLIQSEVFFKKKRQGYVGVGGMEFKRQSYFFLSEKKNNKKKHST